MFTLNCIDRHGQPVQLAYDVHRATLLNTDGSPVLVGSAQRPSEDSWFAAPAISPANPGKKSRSVDVLKIQLGLSCNYSCSYCNQSSQVADMSASKTADSRAFLEQMDAWLEGSPSEIELWGGEPLLYFRKIQALVPELDRRFPDAEISMVTNGSLLTQEIVDFIIEYDIRITMSHDGPAQAIRGADPFDDPEKLELISALWLERKTRQRMIFSSVLTPDNSDPARLKRWFAHRLKDSEVVVSLEGIVAVHDDRTLEGTGRWSDDQYRTLRENVASAFESGDALRIPALAERSRTFLQSVIDGSPSSALGQKCGMDREDHLAVDLLANVLTCHNTGGNGKHGLGSALQMDAVELNTSTHWAHRDNCNHCPVLRLCGGSCMYLEGAQFAQSCENEYQFGLGILDGVLRRIAGLRLTSIDGDVRRPTLQRRIPIHAH